MFNRVTLVYKGKRIDRFFSCSEAVAAAKRLKLDLRDCKFYDESDTSMDYSMDDD